MAPPEMAPPPVEGLTPTPLTMDDVQQLIGALYLEITVLRRQVQSLRAHLEAENGRSP